MLTRHVDTVFLSTVMAICTKDSGMMIEDMVGELELLNPSNIYQALISPDLLAMSPLIGQGKFTAKDRTTYEGEWKDGLKV